MKEGEDIKYIFEHYLPAIIAGAVSLALLAILVALLMTNGPVATAFQKMITDFISKATTSAGL